jgi:hypothetical protein
LPVVGNNNGDDLTEGSPVGTSGKPRDFMSASSPPPSGPDRVGQVVASTRRGVVLSTDERTARDELQRCDVDGRGSARSPRSGRGFPPAFVLLTGVSVLTVIVGAVRPGLGMAFAVGLGWLLWRYLPALGDMVEAASDVDDDADPEHPDLCSRDRHDGRQESPVPAREEDR